MKRGCTNLALVIGLAFALLAVPRVAIAQIAPATLSFVEGDVWVLRADGTRERAERSMNVYFGDEVQTLSTGRAEVNMPGAGILRMTPRTHISFPGEGQPPGAERAEVVDVGFGQAILNLLGFGTTPKGETFHVNTSNAMIVGCEGRLEDGPITVFASFTPPQRGGPFAPGEPSTASQTRPCAQKMQVTRIAGANVEITVDPTTGKTSVRVISKNPDGVVLTRITQDDQGLGKAARRAWLRLEEWEATLPPVVPVAPRPAAPDYGVICRSAMTAIASAHEASTRAQYGPATPTRIEWKYPLRYDNGDCVGGYVSWYTDPADNKEYRTLEWAAETGAGRMAVSALIAKYAPLYPGLVWTTAAGGSTPAPSSPPRRVEPPAPPPAAPPPARQPGPARRSSPPADTPRPATPPATPPATRPAQPPCPPEPLPGLGNQETNLRCFGIP